MKSPIRELRTPTLSFLKKYSYVEGGKNIKEYVNNIKRHKGKFSHVNDPTFDLEID